MLEHLMWLIGGFAIGIITLILYTVKKTQGLINRLGIFKLKISGINHYSDKNIGFMFKVHSDTTDTNLKIKLYLLIIKIAFEYQNGYLETEKEISKELNIGI
jgi:hypothetical protein